MVEFIGLSGPIKFDTSGLRTQFSMDVMELQMAGLVRTYETNQCYEDIQTLFRQRLGPGTLLTGSAQPELRRSLQMGEWWIPWLTRRLSLLVFW